MSKSLYELISLLTDWARSGCPFRRGSSFSLPGTQGGLRRLSGVIAAIFFAALLLGPLVASAQSDTSSRIHIVSWGETLYSIAQRYGVGVDEIVNANKLDSHSIYAGQRLTIPGVPATNRVESSGTHIVQAGENLYRISLQYGISVNELIELNNLESGTAIRAGQKLIVARNQAVQTAETDSDNSVASASTYVVQAGDTLSGISRQFDVSLASLVANNNLLNPSSIYAGQQLAIPGGAAATNRQGYAPAETATTYIVQPGDTLTSIAAQHQTSSWVLAQVNSVANPSLLYVGQPLTIPNNDSLTVSSRQESSSGTPPKAIVVDVSEQRTHVYESGALRWSFVSSTGVAGADTWRGEFQIQNKILNAYASSWDLQMPYWLGFYWAGPLQNGFHALPILSSGARLWEGLLGTPASYGCVILSEHDAQLLYEWAEVGTPVTVQD